MSHTGVLSASAMQTPKRRVSFARAFPYRLQTAWIPGAGVRLIYLSGLYLLLELPAATEGPACLPGTEAVEPEGLGDSEVLMSSSLSYAADSAGEGWVATQAGSPCLTHTPAAGVNVRKGYDP